MTVNNDGSITLTLPAHASGSVDILVIGPGGTSANTAADNFIYAATPTIGSLSPNQGPVAGGTTVTVTGSGFNGATDVNFDGTPGDNLVVSSDTSLTVTSPSHVAGQINVQVVAPGGTSGSSPFTYNDPAAVVSMLPNSGPAAGGTLVTFVGTGFTGTTAVTFDGVAATGINVTGGILMTVTSPPHAAGPVDVVILGPNGASAPTTFTYDTPPAPVVSGVSPSNGPAGGGTTVTVTGTGFTGATQSPSGVLPEPAWPSPATPA